MVQMSDDRVQGGEYYIVCGAVGMVSGLKGVKQCKEAGWDMWFDEPFKTLRFQRDMTIVIQTGNNCSLCHWNYGGCFKASGTMA